METLHKLEEMAKSLHQAEEARRTAERRDAEALTACQATLADERQARAAAIADAVEQATRALREELRKEQESRIVLQTRLDALSGFQHPDEGRVKAVDGDLPTLSRMELQENRESESATGQQDGRVEFMGIPLQDKPESTLNFGKPTMHLIDVTNGGKGISPRV